MINECLKLNEEIGNRYGISISLFEIGNLFYQKRDFDQAEEFYRKALKIKKDISDQEGIAIVYSQIGLLRMVQKDYPEAKKYFNKCYQINKKINNIRNMNFAKKYLDIL